MFLSFDMKIKSYEKGDKNALKELYGLWSEVAKERPIECDKDIQGFENSKLKSESGKVQCFMAFEDSELKGASILKLRPKDANPYLNFLIPKESLESEMTEELLRKSLELCKQESESEVVLSPNIYPQEFINFFKERRFEKQEEYPTGLWMKKPLEDPSEVQVHEGIDIFSVDKLGDTVSARDLAEVQVDYANPNYELEDIIDDFEKLDREQDEISYSIAKLEETGEVFGYSRTIFIDLVRGDSIAKNAGLVVKEEHREKGIGGALLVDSFHRVKKRGYERMYISTLSNNPAQKLYKRLGFEVESEFPNLSYQISE